MPRLTPWRIILAAGALFLAAGIAAPYLSADRFGKSVRSALESSLGRKVEIGKVRFDLFRGPGFRLEEVIIHEDPAFGIEPLAWVDTLEARPNFLALLAGRLEFTSLRLDDPYVNLTKTTRWNFERLIDPKVIAAAPRIAVRNARINFKFADTKSVFYLTAADVDLRAGSDDAWRIEFSGEPARTDRPAHGLGSFSGKGTWKHAGAQDSVDLDLELERSPVGEITALLSGRDFGVRGSISSRVRLKGPVNAIAVTGQLRLEELHRHDQMPLRGAAWPLAFRGRLDLNGQNLDLESIPDARQSMPVSVRYRVSEYLAGEPRWGVNLTWSGFPTEPLAPIARHMGIALPEKLKLDGSMDGAIGYSGRGSLQGSVSFANTSVTLPDSPPLKIEHAVVTLDGERVRLAPARVEAGEDDAVTLEGELNWSTRELEVSLAAESAGVRTLPLRAFGAPAPLLDSLAGGTWRGRLRYRGEWSGQVQLRGVEAAVPGLAEPVRLTTAAVQIQGARVYVDRMQARAGKIGFAGSYRYEPDAARPHRFRLAADEIDGEEWERLLRPTLRRSQGFLQRTLGIGKPSLPDWLSARHAEGSVQIGTLRIAGVEMNTVRSRVVWDAAQVKLPEIEAAVGGGTASGQGSADLSGRSPGYKLALQFGSIEYLGGSLGGEAQVKTAGLGKELVAGLRAQGKFAAKDLELDALGTVRTFEGEFGWSAAEGLALTDLQLRTEADVFTGQGGTQKDGRLLVRLSSGARQLRVSGTLAQLRAE